MRQLSDITPVYGIHRDPKYPLTAQVSLQLEPSLPAFNGHFPTLPIIPGVIQIAWVVEQAEQLLGCSVAVQRMEKLKFERIMQPGDKVTLNLSTDAERTQVTFSYQDEQNQYSSGRLILAADATG